MTFDEWRDDTEWDTELKIKGYEYVRSDVAIVTQDIQYELFTLLMEYDRGTAMSKFGETLRETVHAIENGEYPCAKLGRPFGIGQAVSKYGSPDRRPQPSYRGAKYANQFIYGSEAIGEGDKPLLFYVDRVGGDMRKTYDAETAEGGDYVDAISVLDASDLPDTVKIDTQKMITKTITDPIRPIVQTLGYEVDDLLADTDQSDISTFM